LVIVVTKRERKIAFNLFSRLRDRAKKEIKDIELFLVELDQVEWELKLSKYKTSPNERRIKEYLKENG